MKEILEATYRHHDIKSTTIGRTGPLVIQTVIQDRERGILKVGRGNQDCVKTVGGIDVSIKPVKSMFYRLTQPVIVFKPFTQFRSLNRANWLKVGLNIEKFDDMGKVHQNLHGIIKFERDHFGVLRLEDHLRLIRVAAIKFGEEEGLACEKFLGLLSQSDLDFSKLVAVQWISCDPLVKKFYTERNLLDKTYLRIKTSDERGLGKEIYDWVVSSEIFDTGLFSNKVLKLAPNIWSKMMEETFHREEIEDIYIKLKIGMEFIEMIIRNDDICNLCTRSLDSIVSKTLNKYNNIFIKSRTLFKRMGFPYTEIERLEKRVIAVRQQLGNLRLQRQKRVKIMPFEKKASRVFKSGDFVNSLSLYKQVLESTRATFGENHITTATAYYNVASCLRRLGKVQEAVQLYDTCVTIRRDRLGNADPSTQRARDMLEQCQQAGMGKKLG